MLNINFYKYSHNKSMVNDYKIIIHINIKGNYSKLKFNLPMANRNRHHSNFNIEYTFLCIESFITSIRINMIGKH